MDVARHFMGRATTKTGLRVIAEITHRMYEKGLHASELFLAYNPVQVETFLPELNYTARSISEWLLGYE